MTAQLLYAVIEQGEDRPPLAESGIRGIDDRPLEAVSHQGLVAVVSGIDHDRLGWRADAPGPDDDRVKADLLRYQEVNQLLLQHCRHGGMLPLRFGLTARDRGEVDAVLSGIYLQLKTLLARLKGNAELVVQAVWDLPSILKRIKEEEDQRHPDAGALDPAAVGRMLFEASEARKARYREAVRTRLRPLARDSAERACTTDGMILNHSYLVGQDEESGFDDAVDALATEYEGVLGLRYMGPLPPYSFANVELSQGNFGLVDAARRTLQLPESAAADAIRAAYRTLMLEWHPDRNPDRPQAAARCKEIVAAHEILLAYCASLAPGTPVYSFARVDVEKAFILKG